MKQSSHENLAGYLFLLPIILGILVFTALPFVLSFYYSFTEFDNISPAVWKGFENYSRLFTDKVFLNSLKVTFVYTVISVSLSLFLGFLMGVLMNVKLKGIKLFRVLIYTPCIIPAVASSAIWQDMFNPTHVGIINRFLDVFGIPPQKWFVSEKTAMLTLILMSLTGVGGGMLMWIAGFNNISRSYYEAADLDGANRFQKLVRITLPMMTPLIFYNLVMSIIASLQSFGNAYLLTGGGPFESTNFIALNIYRVGISQFNMGYASAQAWIMFLIIMVFVVVIFRTSGWVYYGDDGKK